MMRPGQLRRPGFKIRRIRVQWTVDENREAQGVVKGVNKRVVVVRSPNPKIFDEAIFIVRDDFWRSEPGDAGRLLKEAQQAANDYIRSSGPGRGRVNRRFGRSLYAAAGALAVGLAWLAVRFVGLVF